MGYKTTWNDVMFGKAQYDSPCIYFVGPEIDGQLYCSYVGQSVNVGHRTFGHVTGYNGSKIPLLLKHFPNPTMELFSLDEMRSMFKPFLAQIAIDKREFGGWFEFLADLWDLIDAQDDLLNFAEHLAIYFFEPELNTYLSGKETIRKYAERHGNGRYTANLVEFDIMWKYYKDGWKLVD